MHITDKMNARWECCVKCSCTPTHHVVRLVDGSDEVVKCRHCGESKTHNELIKEYVRSLNPKHIDPIPEQKGVWHTSDPGCTRVWLDK